MTNPYDYERPPNPGEPTRDEWRRRLPWDDDDVRKMLLTRLWGVSIGILITALVIALLYYLGPP